MCEIISGGVIAIISSAITVLLNLIIEKWKNREEKKRAVLETEIDTYAKAIRYISVIALLEKYERWNCSGDESEKNNLTKEEKELYDSFHPVFSIIAKKEKVEAYNELRNRIEKEQIEPDEAYKMVIELLDYNIWNK